MKTTSNEDLKTEEDHKMETTAKIKKKSKMRIASKIKTYILLIIWQVKGTIVFAFANVGIPFIT